LDALDESTITDEFESGPHDWVDVEHGRLAHWVFGEGPDLVFVHGWPLHGATWRRILPRLATDFRCHVIDMPAVGLSEWDGPMGILEHSETTLQAIEALGLDELGFVAHDSGGSIVRFVAAELGSRVFAIVLGNTEIPGLGLPGLGFAQVMVDLPGSRLAMRASLGVRRIRRKAFESCFADPAYVDGEFGRLFVEPLRQPSVLDGHLRFMKSLDWSTIEEDLFDAHAAIECPVLLIWGERDTWFPWKRAKGMVTSFGGPPAETHLMPEGGLFVHEDHAREFGDVAHSFLASARGL